MRICSGVTKNDDELGGLEGSEIVGHLTCVFHSSSLWALFAKFGNLPLWSLEIVPHSTWSAACALRKAGWYTICGVADANGVLEDGEVEIGPGVIDDVSPCIFPDILQLSSVQNLCRLMIIMEYTIQYLGDFKDPIFWDQLNQRVFHGS